MAIHPQYSTLNGVDTFVLNDGSTGTGRAGQAVAVRTVPFRPAVVGRATFVDNDRPLLAAEIKPLTLKNVSTREAARKLAEVTRKNLVLGIRGFEQSGVDLNAPHDFAFERPAGDKKPMTMKDALLVLVETAMPDADVVITSEDKVITLVSQAEADQRLVTKSYYLEDLLAAMPRFVAGGTDLNDFSTPAASNASTASTATSTGGAARPASAQKPQPKPRPAASSHVLEVITATVRPEIWKHRGGKSEIYMVNNMVTIKAPASVHVLLEGPKAHNPNKVNSYVTSGR
jgi:hypothetical protein